MPTFHSIGFHPALRSRLVVTTGQAESNHTTGNSSNSSLTPVVVRPLETPLSLLLHRAPHELRLLSNNDNNNAFCNNVEKESTTSSIEKSTLVAAHEVVALRRQVASSLWGLTPSGKRQRHVRNVLQSSTAASLCKTTTTSTRTNHEHNNNNTAERPEENYTSSSSNDKNTSKRIRIDGFFSVSEMLQWESKLLLQENPQRMPCLSCGDAALDQLVTDESSSSTVLFGIPWGTVLQLSGPPGSGKTQCALHWAAEAAAATAAAIRAETPLRGATDDDDKHDHGLFVHYLMPAHASKVSVARRLGQILKKQQEQQQHQCASGATATSALSKIWIDTFADDHELLLLLAACEDKWSRCFSQSSAKDERMTLPSPWVLVVDGLPSITTIPARRWHRLVQLYHGIIILVTSNNNNTSSSSSSSSSLGSIHLHLEGNGRMYVRKHTQWDKVGTSVPFPFGSRQQQPPPNEF